MKKLRIYCDTSVFGGCFDDEFALPSLRLIEEIKSGRRMAVVSPMVISELMEAPRRVLQILRDLPAERVQIQPLTEEVLALRDAYLKEAVVAPSSIADAEHVAAASVALADIIVSWNFKHIVNFDRIRKYQAVNMMNGYSAIGIHTPAEVIENEN